MENEQREPKRKNKKTGRILMKGNQFVIPISQHQLRKKSTNTEPKLDRKIGQVKKSPLGIHHQSKQRIEKD